MSSFDQFKNCISDWCGGEKCFCSSCKFQAVLSHAKIVSCFITYFICIICVCLLFMWSNLPLWSYLLFMWSYLVLWYDLPLWYYLLFVILFAFIWSYVHLFAFYVLLFAFMCSYLIYLCLPVLKIYVCLYICYCRF
jgi:hypothetical protein